jgi:hypothetical protein
MTTLWPKIETIKKIKPLGSTSPWVWVIEPHFGCNLKCGHCCSELISKKKFQSMSFKTWCSLFEVLNAVSPTVRMDICGIVGEPTLNPKLTEWLPKARELAPQVQIQITTNGTMLRQGRVKYKDLLDAGANIIYTDQYGTHGEFEKLASESGYPFYQYYDPPAGAWSPWTYYGPHLKMIVLMDHPGNWPKSRFKAGLLGNWYGNLNWEKGKRFGMFPLKKPLIRRCNQPFLYVNVAANGSYLLCCQDGMHITDGMFGNVSDGIEGFHNFWYGKKMQVIRRRLRNKDRAGTKFACAKCNITFSRCDFKHWKPEQLNTYWDGKKWKDFDTPIE